MSNLLYHYVIQNRTPVPGQSAVLKCLFIKALSGLIKDNVSYILIEICTEFVSGLFPLSFFFFLLFWTYDPEQSSSSNAHIYIDYSSYILFSFSAKIHTDIKRLGLIHVLATKHDTAAGM